MQHAEWIRARNVENSYSRKLRQLASHIDHIINGFDPLDWSSISGALERYAEAIGPWAQSVAGRMLAELAARDKSTWRKASKEIERQLHLEIQNAPTGIAMRSSLEEQVALIQSMPVEAARRVQRIALGAAEHGQRSETIVPEIMRTGQVTKSRANVIARTEVGRALTALTSSRAQYVGSTHFVWRTMKDSHVRSWHRRLEGKAFEWNNPPECDPGIFALPGSSPNCRCYSEPIIPDV